jgi:hypothetical protein
MATQPDLWGEIAPATKRTPLSIMREQAALLGQKTHNLVEARVETDVDYSRLFKHRFLLVVPALNDYEYQLFRVEHSIDLYPVEVQGAEIRSGYGESILRNEDAFVEWLGQMLSSQRTKGIIANLLAQVTT